MAIGTDSAIWTFGTQDEVTSGTPGSVADNEMEKADQGNTVNWTNDDNAPWGAAVLKYNFATAPTKGSIVLVAHCLSVQSTNDIEAPDTTTSRNFDAEAVGVFPLNFGDAGDVYTGISNFEIPAYEDAQAIDWYIWNRNTGQSIDASWELYITPKALVPHA